MIAWNFPVCSSRIHFGTFSGNHYLLPVCMSRTRYCLRKPVERLKSYCKGYFVNGISQFAPLEWNSDLFYTVIVFCLSRSTYWLQKSVKRLRSYCRGYIAWNWPVCSPRMKLGTFLVNHCVLLVGLSRSRYCLRKSVEWLKSYWGGYFCMEFPFPPGENTSGNLSGKHWALLVCPSRSRYCLR
jgi:hypothetical protein